MARKAEITLELQNYIEHPPVQPEQLYGNAAANDKVTVDAWRKIWVSNIRENKKRFGSFKEHGVGKLFNQWKLGPAIIAGSGPSLKVNGHLLKERAGIPLVSCLHNFHFFEDNGVEVDYYVSLDAGEVVVEEVSEGGKLTADEYWEKTKGKKLIAFIGTHPRLFEKWQGEIYLFNAQVPDESYRQEIEAIEPFHTYVSNGGNVLGACLYIAKGIFGANPIAFVGADFCFSYDKKFHGWDSKYDAHLGHVLRTVDIYGQKVVSWQSYINFKCWFDYIAVRVPGVWVNCTEGGTFGAYPEGNIMAVKQMDLKDFLGMYQISEHIRGQCERPRSAPTTSLVLTRGKRWRRQTILSRKQYSEINGCTLFRARWIRQAA
jgi:hypothetical protein